MSAAARRRAHHARRSVSSEVLRERPLSLWSKGGPVVSWRGWTAGGHFLGWRVTHKPISGKADPNPHQIRTRRARRGDQLWEVWL